MLRKRNAVHAWSFSVLTVLTLARNPNKPTVVSTIRPGIRQEQWWHLWRSGFRCYLCAHLTFVDQLREWQARHSRPLFEAESKPWTTNNFSQSPGSFVCSVAPWYCFVVADWCIRDSGGLVKNRNPQFFTTFIVKAASVTFHGRVWRYLIRGELVYIA